MIRDRSLPRRAFLFGTGLAGFGLAAPPKTLFQITRSKNENRVLYDARLDASGRFERDRPLDVYWRMDAEDGRREELTALERSLAYGVTVKNVSASGVVTVSIAAMPRPIRLAASSSGIRGTTKIAERDARLASIFVQARETLLLPAVEYVDLVGFVGAETVRERLLPKS